VKAFYVETPKGRVGPFMSEKAAKAEARAIQESGGKARVTVTKAKSSSQRKRASSKQRHQHHRGKVDDWTDDDADWTEEDWDDDDDDWDDDDWDDDDDDDDDDDSEDKDDIAPRGGHPYFRVFGGKKDDD